MSQPRFVVPDVVHLEARFQWFMGTVFWLPKKFRVDDVDEMGRGLCYSHIVSDESLLDWLISLKNDSKSHFVPLFSHKNSGSKLYLAISPCICSVLRTIDQHPESNIFGTQSMGKVGTWFKQQNISMLLNDTNLRNQESSCVCPTLRNDSRVDPTMRF